MPIFILLFAFFSHALNLEQKVGQVLFVGISGKSFTLDNQKHLEEIKPGGIIFFRHNFSEPYKTYRFTKQLHDWSKAALMHPLIIGVDQEGGLVSRIKTMPRAPSAANLGRVADLSKVEAYAKTLGLLLQIYGFNLNFAPVLDQTTPSFNDFIGTRAFSHNLDSISRSASAFAKGLKFSSILTVGKHFPGHGQNKVDSHKTLPSQNYDKKALLNGPTKPFVNLYRRNLLDAVMVGHLSFPKIDPTNLPATFSRPLLTDFLRNDLSYQGLIITDDIEMKAAGISSDPGERAVLAFEAGADMIMVAWNKASQKKAFHALLNAVKSGRVSLQRLNESYNRIQNAKALLQKPLEFRSQEAFKRQLAKLPWKKAVDSLSSNVDWPEARAKLSQLSSSEIVVASADRKLLESSNNRVKIFLHPSIRVDEIEQHLGADKVLIFHSTSPTTLRLLKKISPKLRPQIFVLNTSRPLLAKSNYLFVMNLLERNQEAERFVLKDFSDRRSPSSK